jgi:ABC-type transporter Mla subunit MlaD
MTDSQSAGSVPGINELLGLLGNNPFAGLGRTFDQLRKGVGELLHTVENINATMTELNRIASRVNGLLDTVEEPIQRVAPGLDRLADTLSSPAMMKMPDELSRFISVIGDVATKIQPLGQLAEAAGGMFGLRNLAGGLLGGATGGTAKPATAPPTAPAAKIQTAVSAPAAPSKPPTAAKPKAPAKKRAATSPAKKAPAPKKR